MGDGKIPRRDYSSDPLPQGAIVHFGTVYKYDCLACGWGVFSSDGKLLQTADGVWEIETGNKLVDLDVDGGTTLEMSVDGGVFSLSVSDDVLRTRLVRGESALVQAGDFQLPHHFQWLAHTAQLIIAPIPSGRAVEVWNPLSQNRLATTNSYDLFLLASQKRVYGLTASPNLNTLTWPSRYGLSFWDLKSGEVTHPAEQQAKPYDPKRLEVLFSRDGAHLALYAKEDGKLHLFDVTKASRLWSVELAAKERNSSIFAAFSPDDRFLFAATTRLDEWKPGDSGRLPALSEYDASDGRLVKAIPIHNGGDLLTFICSRESACLDITDQWRASVLLHPKYPDSHLLAAMERCVAISPDGNLLAYCRPRGEVSIYERASRIEIVTFHSPEGQVTNPLFSPDGRRLATRVDDNSVIIWDITLGSGAPSGLDQLWSDLASSDGQKSRRAVWKGASLGDSCAAFLGEHLKAAKVDSELVRRLIDDLDADSYAVRQKASRDIQALGNAAQPFLAAAPHRWRSAVQLITYSPHTTNAQSMTPRSCAPFGPSKCWTELERRSVNAF